MGWKERFRRWAAAQKFYATLPSKLDEQERLWLEEQPQDSQPTYTFSNNNWTIQKTAPWYEKESN